MRYSTVFKFLAVILCAATLLGAVGSATALVFLTELGNKSVQEQYVDQLENQALNYSMHLGGEYVSRTLGGAHRDLIDRHYGYWEGRYFDGLRMGYTLYDPEGNAVLQQELSNDRAAEHIFTLPVYGQYMHVISAMPYEEKYPQETVPTSGEETRVTVMPSQEMTEIGWVALDYTNGTREEYQDGALWGWLYVHGDAVVFETQRISNIPMGDGWYVNHIALADMGGNIVYEAYDDACVIQAMDGGNNQLLVTLPKGMATAAAPAGMTFTSGDYTSYDAIPTQGVTVTAMSVTYGNLQGEALGSEGVSSPDLIGTLFHDAQGNAVFRSTEPMSMDIPQDSIITHITFADAQSNALFEASCPGGVGRLYNDENGCLVFEGHMPGTDVPEEAIPEETAAAEEPAAGKTYVVEATNVYIAPNFQAEVVDTLENTEVEILQEGSFTVGEETQHWALIRQGWIPRESIMQVHTAGQSGETDNALPAEEGRKIYATPSIQSDVLGTLEDGEEPEVLQQGDFNGTLWGLTREGWILLTDEKAQPEAAAEKTVPEATEATAPVMARTVEEPAEETTATEPESTEETVAEAVEVTEAAEEPETAETVAYSQADVESTIYYENGQEMVADFVMLPIPEGYTLDIQLAKGALRNEFGWTLLRLAKEMEPWLLKALGVCIALFVLCVVHLCCSAGRTRRNNEVRAGGLNRIPLDLYLGGGGFAVVGLAAAAFYGAQYFARNDDQLAIVFFVACAYLASLLVVGFFFAAVAQFKTPGGFWWRHSFCGWSIRLMILGCTGAFDLCIKGWVKGKPLAGRFFGWLGRTCRALWNFGKKTVLWLWDISGRLLGWAWEMVGKGFRWTTEKLVRFFGLLPITWQFLLTGFTLVFLLYVVLRSYKVGWILVGFGLFFATILYAASAFAILLESAKRMSKGNLDTKVDDKLLIGGFRDFAGQLNDLADVAVVAAQKQLKSERMKTELITNVSHDIKTPLTSIINYVDLLQKPHTEEQQVQYLEVLDRQSQRLKKLIDDLMEMSKASTGNMAVEISRMDAGEAVNQALGEFADKLERAQLIPVFRQPEDKVEMMADGRLVWRVMSNLLGNAVKYALPGTRIYVDLLEMEGKVIISMKNISREELNVNADELLERFVRGDASRNTEGSGLGLNIAQSLMELQKGQLQILVDGDLFKVTLIFPGA
ncbi:MAG: HAMP domain-containing histidine kinase [Oscillospiraceae bacterium]|nr:HAMP domain-containing histidine kinase [Oscillospiraceae bacterium]